MQVLTNQTNAAGDGGLSNAPLFFGRNAASGVIAFDGTLDAVAYYDSILDLATAESHASIAVLGVPEPSTLWLGMGGLALLAARARRRRPRW